jgi:DNA-binding HxlR family transcriptional regulator
MARADFGAMSCSIARTLDVIGDPWTPLILRDLHAGLRRFDELVEDLGISRNLLARRLDHLVARGVVERRRYRDHPPRDDYVLTEPGRDLGPVLMAIMAWGDRWVAPEAGPPARLRHSCGEVVVPVVACPACGEPMTAETVTALPGPGGRSGPGTRLVGAFLAGDAGT